MAYWTELRRPCLVTPCPHAAVVEVFNRVNASQGCYCREHGRRLLNDLRSSEAVAHARAARERATGPGLAPAKESP